MSKDGAYQETRTVWIKERNELVPMDNIRTASCSRQRFPLPSSCPSAITNGNVQAYQEAQSSMMRCYNTVRTPTLCKPDTSDRPLLFSYNLLNLATPLLSYVVRLVLLIFVLLSSLPCYLYDAVLILTSDILYSLIDMFLSILRYISTHVFVVEP
jgi:hypothetical protein